MSRLMHPLARVGQIVATLLAAAVIALVAGFLLAWSGLYNIAASRGHLKIVEWFLTFGMRNSIETHAKLVGTPPPLNSPDLYILGAGHYYRGCAPCHGAPEGSANPIAHTMLPPPPDLTEAVNKWKDRELFWIVKHGIKYTGMPAWVAQSRDDEVWAVVAFVRKLPKLGSKAYHELVFGKNTSTQSGGGDAFLASTVSSDLFQSCLSCHGREGQRPPSNLVPLLHGLRREYLVEQLEAFRSGRRQSGIMQPVAAALPQSAVQGVADFYARLVPPPVLARDAALDIIEKGKVLATQGSAYQQIPACLTCHRSDAVAIFPRLHGQNADYLTGRLQRWKAGNGPNTESEAIMAPIAKLLNDEQIEEVSAYFASRPPTPSSPARQP
jgi:cytochrome c553